jgi:hypothetical protein
MMLNIKELEAYFKDTLKMEVQVANLDAMSVKEQVNVPRVFPEYSLNFRMFPKSSLIVP